MYEAFLLIAVVAFFAMLIGLLNPKWILFTSSKPSRGKVLLVTWSVMIAGAVLYDVTMPPEVKAEMEAKREAENAAEAEQAAKELAAAAEQEREQKLAAEAAERKANARAGAEKLFKYYEGFEGNYRKGEFEQELLDGEITYECKVAGKYPLYFGRLKMRTTIFGGMVMPADKDPADLYIYVVDMGDGQFQGAFRGEEYVDVLLNTITGQYGCSIPEKNVMLGKA